MLRFTHPLPGLWPPNADSIFGADRTGHTHGGHDYNAPTGIPIRASAQGQAIQAGQSAGVGGLAVTLNHGQGWATFYCHLSEIWVNVGDTVPAGGLIGAVGATGNAEAPHLHVEWRLHGQPVDPALLICPEAGDAPVGWLQKRLTAHHYDPGPVDGWMGPRTCAALSNLQANRNLEVTGTADDPTLTVLRGSPRSWPLHPPDVERWRPLVKAAWESTGEPVDYILQIMWAESRGNPNNLDPTYQASGLFQHLAGYWSARAAAAGWPDANIFAPQANIAVAAWLWQQDGWGAWEATLTYPRNLWSSGIRWLGDRYGTP